MSDQCSKTCGLEQQYLPVCLSTFLSVCLFVTNLRYLCLKYDSLRITILYMLRVDQAFSESLCIFVIYYY